MKRKFLIAVFICSIFFGVCGQSGELMKKMFSDRKKYYSEEIPDTFKFLYQRFQLKQDSFYVELENKLRDIDFFCINNKGIIYIESLGIPSFTIYGSIISGERVLSYRLDTSGELVFKPSGFRYERFDIFVKDLIEWNENVTDRSFVNSEIADAPLFFCSVFESDTLKTTAFAFYNKDDPYVFGKERKNDNYKPRIIIQE